MTTELDQEIAKLKAEFSKAGTTFAKEMKRETGMDLPEVFVHIAVSIFVSRRMWRAAKADDTAKTVAYGVTLMNAHAQQRDKIRKHQRTREEQKAQFSRLN